MVVLLALGAQVVGVQENILAMLPCGDHTCTGIKLRAQEILMNVLSSCSQMVVAPDDGGPPPDWTARGAQQGGQAAAAAQQEDQPAQAAGGGARRCMYTSTYTYTPSWEF